MGNKFFFSCFSFRETFFHLVEDLIRSVVTACSATKGWRIAVWKEVSQLVLRYSSLLAVPRRKVVNLCN